MESRRTVITALPVVLFFAFLALLLRAGEAAARITPVLTFQEPVQQVMYQPFFVFVRATVTSGGAFFLS
jgi:hypothetical protein